MNPRKLVKSRRKALDKLENAMAELPQVMLEVKEEYTDGMYIRTIYMPKGTMLTSEIHKKQHPFVITQGVIQVQNIDTGEVITYEAPYNGITQPMTRRLLYVIEDTVWTTYHPNPENKNIMELAKDILVERPHLTPQYKIQNQEVKEIEL